MCTKKHFLQTLFAITVLSITGIGLWWHFVQESAPPNLSRMHVETPQQADLTPTLSQEVKTQPVSLTGNAWTVTIDEGADYTMALDEAMLRAADGTESLIRLEPPATRKTLKQRLAGLAAEHNASAWPVVYPADRPRDEAHRRLVTPDLRIRLAQSEAAAFAQRHQLVVKDLPDYAPGWAVLAAADPFEALAAMERLRAAGFATADVLLAAQRQKRVMPNDSLINNQWHLKNTNNTRTHINVENAWNYGGSGVKGAGIRIGIVDDGLQTDHPDLVANVDTLNDRDWNGNDSDPKPGVGDDHGTACAGNAAARGNNSLGVSGSAPEATLVGMRLIGASVTDAQEAEAMAWKNDIIHLKSNSWGPNDTATILEAPGALTKAAMQTAVTTGRGGKGTILFWAGGNGGDIGDNSNYDGYANSIHTIAIGATDSAGNRAYYSEPGANLVVCAPSSGATGTLDITTTDRTGTAGYNTSSGGDYANDFGGTSSATPTAAGVAALMLEKNPNLGWRDVQEILIRSAFRVKPTDADWTTNSAGFWFNHNFGAGLIDATAAVNLAAGWANLGPQTSDASTQSALTIAIPDNNATGITRSFNLSTSNLRVEHVTVRLSASHTYRGNLEIILTSPSGMSSRLAEKHSDSNDNISNWTYSSVRHWGEISTGTWTLRIADRSASGTGSLTAVELVVYGTTAAPVNTPPLVRITSPSNAAVFSPGTTVQVAVDASDLDIAGNPGSITQVELLQNDIVVGTDDNAPYEFAISPANGNHTLVARATDSEDAVGVSASVIINVFNQPPVITAAALSAGSQAFADEGLSVLEVLASDSESTPLTTSYQWQASSDGRIYQDVAGANSATLTAAPELAGKLWRCVVAVSDGETTSAPFTTTACNVIHRPPATADIGTALNYNSGLVLRGGGSVPGRPAIIHELSQGPVGGSAEWIEILVLQTTSLAYWDIQDSGGTMLIFRDSPLWDDIPAGTLIVIYNSASKDPLLPADDLDPTDGRMIIASNNSTYFDTASGSWPSLSNTGDSIYLSDADSIVIHQLAYGTSTAATPNIGSAGSGAAAYFNGTNDDQANLVANWTVTSSTVARSLRAAGDLLISEYLEGFSNNKALELYNPSSSAVDLAAQGYRIEIYFNGATTAYSNITLTGSIAAGGTFVIKNTSASASISAQQTSSLLTFNGDDAIILRKGSNLADSFGRVGEDPGTAWSGGGVSTVDKTLRRKLSVTQGDANPGDSFDPSLEWLQFNIDDFTDLGSHATDDEPTLTGVTPGAANTPANAQFVADLRSGALGNPALFRLASGTVLPDGLTLDPASGLLSGVPATSNPPGAYPIVIESYNSLGETVSVSFTLTLNGGGGNDYATWIAIHQAELAGLTGRNDDPDGDGLPNAVENLLGTSPSASNAGLTNVSSAPCALVFYHTRNANPASDVTAAYEWSANLLEWHDAGESSGGVTVEIIAAVVTDEAHPDGWMRVTATCTAGQPGRFFVRLAAR